MKTAVIYARYSSERQTEQSIEGQLRECMAYAEHHDMMVVDTYVDRAMTGTNDNRHDFQRMLKDAQKKAWDVVRRVSSRSDTWPFLNRVWFRSPCRTA